MSTINNVPVLSNRFFYYMTAVMLTFSAILLFTEGNAVHMVSWCIATLIYVNLAHCDNLQAKEAGFKETDTWWVILVSPVIWGAIRIMRTNNQPTLSNLKGFLALVIAFNVLLGALFLKPESNSTIADTVCEIINDTSNEPYFLEGVKCDHAQVVKKTGDNSWVVNIFKTDGGITPVDVVLDTKTDLVHVL